MRPDLGPARSPIAAAIVLALAGSPACGPGGGGSSASDSARLELHDCRAGVADAKCGRFEVPEDREAPGGRTLELAVVVVPASSRKPASDPVFFLAGGPGQGAAELAPMVVRAFEPITRERDLVFVDLRGTGQSNPLDCEFEDPEDLHQLLGPDLRLDEIDECLASYEADTRLYHTDVMVDDLDEVRAALGYEGINLLGISHGTRAALVYMRRHGEHVRSAVLDGAAPLEVPVMLDFPPNGEAALSRVLADCEATPECAAAFPGLERKLEQVLRELEKNRELEELHHPRTGVLERVEITRPGFVSALRMALYSAELSSLVPLVIERAHGGDYGPAAAMLLRSAKLSKTLSMGLYLSVACAEGLGSTTPAQRREVAEGLQVFDEYMLDQLASACERWRYAELPQSFWEPVTSDAPTLVLSGRYDPVTPPAYGERVAEQLGDARHVVVDAVSHGVWWRGCAPRVMAEFFASADPAALDLSCLESLPRPRLFVSPNGPRPVPAAEPAPEPGPELAPKLAKGSDR